MLTLHPQYIKDADGNRYLVVLPAKEFNSIIEELDDIDVIRLSDTATPREQVFTDAETFFNEIEAIRSKNV